LYSGLFVDELEALARSCGAAGVIAKNGDQQQLVQQLERLVSQHQAPAGLDTR
jgi:hypothetical protein